jgi:hypothetical protein
MQVAGQFSDFSLMDQYYLAWVGFNEIYKFFHNSWPTINWTGIAFLFFNTLGLFLILSTLKRFYKIFRVPVILGLLLQIIISLAYIDNIVSITHTRFSILFCGLAIMNFGLFKNMTRKEYLFYILIFIIGALHRPESGIGLFVLIMAALVLIRFHIIFNGWKRFILPVIFMVLLYGSFTVDWLNTDLYERKLEPNIEYALTTKRLLPIDSMTNAQDSLRYKMATQGFFIDEEFVSIDFLRRITSVEMEFDPVKFKMSFLNLLNWYMYFTYFPFLIIILAILAIISRAKFIFWIKFISVNLLFFVFMSYISYGTNIAPRHVSGLLILNTIGISYIFFNHVKFRYADRFWSCSLASLLLFPAFLTVQNYHERYEKLYEEVLCFNAFMDDVEEQYQGEYIIITLLNYHLFDQVFKLKNELRKRNTYLMYDIIYYSKVPPYNDYLAEICSCDPKDPLAFFTWMEERKALYILAERRVEMTQMYLSEVKESSMFFEVEEHSFIFPSCLEDFHNTDIVFSRLVNDLE